MHCRVGFMHYVANKMISVVEAGEQKQKIGVGDIIGQGIDH